MQDKAEAKLHTQSILHASQPVVMMQDKAEAKLRTKCSVSFVHWHDTGQGCISSPSFVRDNDWL